MSAQPADIIHRRRSRHTADYRQKNDKKQGYLSARGIDARRRQHNARRHAGAMLDEILSEKWEDEQEDERENADEQHTQEKE